MTAVTHSTTAQATTLLEALRTTVARQPDAIAVRTIDGEASLTWAHLDDRARRLAAGLQRMGVGPGDSVGVMLTNDLPFYVVDLAVVMLGAVPVPIYATASPEQIAHVAADADLRAAITQAAFVPALSAGLAAHPDCDLICVEPAIAGTFALDDVAAGDPLSEPHSAAPDELLTIIYTSGTTGPSKGVELTHSALMSATAAVAEFALLHEGGRVISWLPLAHIAERIASYYAAVAHGLEVVVCPDPKQIASYLPQVQPSFFFAVPRVWEKLRAGILAKVAAQPEEVQQAFAARAPEFMAGLRQLVGLGSVKVAAVGAAPSDPETVQFFHEIGVPLGDIYGLTESAACCTANPPGRVRIGSAGLPMPGMEVRIAEDGEVETRGPALMRGYRKPPGGHRRGVHRRWLPAHRRYRPPG